jgi:hypothetical protein
MRGQEWKRAYSSQAYVKRRDRRWGFSGSDLESFISSEKAILEAGLLLGVLLFGSSAHLSRITHELAVELELHGRAPVVN